VELPVDSGDASGIVRTQPDRNDWATARAKPEPRPLPTGSAPSKQP